MNERGIWTTREEVATHVCDDGICAELVAMFPKVQTIADIGCGNGAYTRYLEDAGFDAYGFDGSPLTPDFCQQADFSQSVDIGTYDMALCLEVGEHIPARYEQTFLYNVCNAARRWVVLSWAVPGQGGDGHVNCRDNYWVVQQMQRRGFNLDAEKTFALRAAATVSWFKNTLMVFHKVK